MTKVIMVVKRAEEAKGRDLELPLDLSIAKLEERVAKALGWDMDATGHPVTYSIEAQPPGRLLHPDMTLAQAQVWDGTLLIFHPKI